MTIMKKEYYKPETRYFMLAANNPLMEPSKKTNGTPAGNGGEGEDGGELKESSRFAFWDDFDEDLLEDIEDVNDFD